MAELLDDEIFLEWYKNYRTVPMFCRDLFGNFSHQFFLKGVESRWGFVTNLVVS